MKVVKIDILLEVPRADLARLGRDGAARYVIEKLRHGAEQKAHEVNGRVLSERPPEFQLSEGSSITDGGDYLLMAGRFEVEVPDAFDPAAQPGAAVVSRNRILLPG